MHETRTRSPGATVVTASPTSTTMPTASWPRIVPGVTSGTSPFRMWRSVPQIVADPMRTIASVGSRMTGSGTDSQPRFPGPWYTSACMAPPFVSRPCSRRAGPAESGPALRTMRTSPQLHREGGGHDDTLRELDEPRRVAPLVVVPGDDGRLRPSHDRGQAAVDD